MVSRLVVFALSVALVVSSTIVYAQSTAGIPKSWIDTDTGLTANSNRKIPSQKAVKAYADAIVGMTYPGVGVPKSTGSAWDTSYTVGTAASNLVQLDGSAHLPAVDASALTGITPKQVVGAVVANGNSGASKTINWTTGTVQSLTISENTVLTFTAPGGPCHLTLILTNPGAFAITWPTMLWAGGSAPAWTAAGVDIATFLYTSGTTYYGQAGLDFK